MSKPTTNHASVLGAQPKIRWHVQAHWSADRYGLDAPFGVPESWEPLGSGFDMEGGYYVRWHTPPATAIDLKTSLRLMDTRGVSFHARAARPDWVYRLEPIPLAMLAVAAWNKYGEQLMFDEPVEPPQEADFCQKVLDEPDKPSRASSDGDAFQPGQAAALSLRRFGCTVCAYWWFEWDGDQFPSGCPSCSIGTGEPQEAYRAFVAPVSGH